MINSPAKLFMLLIGCKPPGRHTEQHDVFFGIAPSLKDLVPQINDFWPQSGKVHLDAWREVTMVDGYRVQVVSTGESVLDNWEDPRLFFINLGGYTEHKFEEQHYNLITVKANKADAYQEAKQTLFFQKNHFHGAESHIDDKYGIDVDDLYQIEEMLSPGLKEKYFIKLEPAVGLPPDVIHLGYFKLNSL